MSAARGPRAGSGAATQPPPVQLTAILTLALVASTFIQADFGVLSKSIIRDLQLSHTDLALMLTVFAFVGAGTAPLMGHATDVLGGRAVLAGALVVSALCTLLIAAAPGLGAMLAVATVAGLALGAGHPATNKLSVVYVRGRPQGAVLGIKQSGPPLGVLLAGLILPSTAAALGWRDALALMAVIPTVALVWLLAVIPTDERASRTPGSKVPLSRWARETMWWLTAIGFVISMGVSSLVAFLPLYAQEGIGMSAKVAGIVASSVGLLGIAARAAWGWYATRFRHAAAPLAAIALASVAATAGLWAAARAGVALLWLGACVAGATLLAWHAVAWIALAADVEVRAVGRASGVVHFGSTFGFGVGPLAFGLIVDHASYAWAWAAVMSLLGVAFVMTCAWLVKSIRRPAGVAPPDDYRAGAAVC